MRIRVVLAEGGHVDIYVKRTRAGELRVRPALSVPLEDLEKTVAKLVAETRDEIPA